MQGSSVAAGEPSAADSRPGSWGRLDAASVTQARPLPPETSALNSPFPAHVWRWILGPGLGGHTAWAEQGPPGFSSLRCLLPWVILGHGWSV